MFEQGLRMVYADGVLITRVRKPRVNQFTQDLRKVYAEGNLLMYPRHIANFSLRSNESETVKLIMKCK